MLPPERSPYEHSLLELCGRIHGHCTGSGDGISDQEARELRDWLQWRINEGWQPPYNTWFGIFDNAVRELCIATLAELEAEMGGECRP